MNEEHKKKGFLDWIIDIPETRVHYLTKPTPIDRIFAKTFLLLIPSWVTPNHITKCRFLSIPVIIYFFLADSYLIGTILFLFSAFSDALDGALARTKKMVTAWGMLYDPIADKLLVGSVAVIIISKHLSLYLATTIVFLELFLVLSAYFRYKGKVVPAKIMGKLKMILQCVGIIFLLFGILFDANWLFITAEYTLYTSIIFAILSLFVFRSI